MALRPGGLGDSLQVTELGTKEPEAVLWRRLGEASAWQGSEAQRVPAALPTIRLFPSTSVSPSTSFRSKSQFRKPSKPLACTAVPSCHWLQRETGRREREELLSFGMVFPHKGRPAACLVACDLESLCPHPALSPFFLSYLPSITQAEVT